MAQKWLKVSILPGTNQVQTCSSHNQYFPNDNFHVSVTKGHYMPTPTQLGKVRLLSTKAQFWKLLFQRQQNEDLPRMRALISQVTSRSNINWKPLLLLEREVETPKEHFRVPLKRRKKPKKPIRGLPKSRSRNNLRLPWRASLLTLQKLDLWNCSCIFL